MSRSFRGGGLYTCKKRTGADASFYDAFRLQITKRSRHSTRCAMSGRVRLPAAPRSPNGLIAQRASSDAENSAVCMSSRYSVSSSGLKRWKVPSSESLPAQAPSRSRSEIQTPSRPAQKRARPCAPSRSNSCSK